MKQIYNTTLAGKSITKPKISIVTTTNHTTMTKDFLSTTNSFRNRVIKIQRSQKRFQKSTTDYSSTTIQTTRGQSVTYPTITDQHPDKHI
jgi:hypothetical protein